MRAIDCWLNVNMGELGRPDYLVEVAKNYFKQGEDFFRNYSIDETVALMDELEVTKPRFIVDASRATWFETEAWIYDLRNYPEFELNALLETKYREIARVDDCPIWERVD